MSIRASQYKQLLREYDQKRTLAQHLLRQKQKEIYSKIPEILQIDQALSSTGIEISKAILQSPNKVTELIESLEKKNLNLIIRKAELLHTHGYPKNYLEISYECEKCQDTGYIESTPCSCLKQRLIELAYTQSNLRNILEIENFEHFDFQFYSTDVDPEMKISPRENMKRIYNICVRFVTTFDEEFSNLIFYGNPGLGKTFLCNCIAKDLLDQGKTVLYLTAFQLFKIFEDHKFRPDEHTEEDQSYLDAIFDVDLLIIDDLGTEFSTALTGAELFNCLNSRLLDKKSTIISTNLSPGDWQNQYSSRIVSRVFGHYKALKFFGEDIRLKKKYAPIANH
ncbi:MAG: ATP-binding protein [Epulopiscium sp.]|nr:ATP-binding protein [Candidatus Epulonipiscium sp.]